MNFLAPTQDTWHVAPEAAGSEPAAHRLFTPEQWTAVRATWPRELPAGLRVPNTLDVETLADELPRLSAVQLEFPKWVDGRA